MQTIIVDTTPGYRMPTVFYSQGDIGTQFAIDLRSRFGDTLPANPTVTIQATKPSGLGYSVAATSFSSGVAIFTMTETMTNEAGRFPAELKVVDGSVTLFTANFNMEGEASAHPEGTTDGDIEHILPQFMSVNVETLAAGTDATYSYDPETNSATFGIPQGANGSLASSVLAPTYSTSATYAVGDYVYYNGNLYRCTTAITTAEAWTSGHWALVAVGPELTDVKSAINNIENDVYSSKSYYPAIYVDDMADAVAKTGWNVSSTSGVIPITELVGYDSYYFVADSDFNLWFDTLESTYVCVAHGTNFTGVLTYSDGHIGLECTSPTRYRTTDNNLPTEASPLTVQAGDVLAFTFTSGTVTPFYGIASTKKDVKLKSVYSGSFTKTTDSLTILTDKARYVFKKVTNAGINIDTWRLYSGELKRKDGTYFTMWANSDAEGVVQIDGESDFIGGYHGDEEMTNIRIFADGVDITDESNLTKAFDVISIYVESDVFHCESSSIAFKRNKWLCFNGEKVKIGNEWTAQSALSIASAPLALFQCYYKENDAEVATDYMANSDYKLYQMSTPATHTPNSKDSTEFTLETKINPIRFKSIKTNGANPMGVVAYKFISAQNRVKFYYYTIYSTTAVANGDKLISEFEFEVM